MAKLEPPVRFLLKKTHGTCKPVTAMKKFMKPFVLVAAAAMALASCQKNEFDAPQKQELHFTIKAGIETKTSITDNGDGTYSPSWHKGDQIGIFFTEPEKKVETVDATFSNTEEDGPVASFEGTATGATDGILYAFYPKSAFNQHYGDETIRLDLPAVQKPTSTSFDPECDILVAKPYDYLAEGETVVIDDLYFARLMSVLKINLKGEFAQGEVVESLTFSVDGVDITGNAKVDYKTATIKGWNNGSVKRNTVTATYSAKEYITIDEENNSAYLVIAPVTIETGTALTFTLKTTNYNISKTVSAYSDMTFTAGNLSVLNLTIKEEDCATIDTPIDYSGVYLIAGKEGDKWYAAKKYTSGNYLSVSEIEFIGENIVETETISDHYMTIDKVADGTYKGMYTIVDAGGKYLSAVSGDDNYLKAVAADNVSGNSYWSIEKDEEKGTYSIVASKSSDAEKNHMRFNYNNGTNSRVTCYGSTSTQPYLTLFSTSLVKPDTTPRITVTKTSYSALAADTSVEIPYTVKNITGNITATVASGATMSNVSTNVTTNKVTVSFAANEESSEKTATIVLSYDGAQSVNVVIAQAGKAPEISDQEAQETLTFSDRYSANTVLKDVSVQATNFNVSFAGAGTAAQYYANGTSVRAYAKNTFTVSSDKTIVKVEITFGSSDGSNAITTDVGSYQNETWTGSAKSVTFTVGGTSGNRRIAAITVHYTDSTSGETPDPEQPTLTPRNLAYSPNTATATVGQAFNAPTLSGAKFDDVTYSSSNTAVATVNASTGAVTLLAAGTTIITASASATDQYEAGTASYTLTVSAAQPEPEQPGQGGGDEPEQPSAKKTYTLTISVSDFNSTSYAANNNEKTSTATATDGSTLSVKWTSNQIMKGTGANSSKMQWKKNEGYIFNSTDLGTIEDITVDSSAGTYTKNIGTSSKPSSSGSGGYFNIKVGNATGYSTKVTITFTK